MGLIVDTSVLIAAERGAVRMEALLEAYRAEPVGIAAITASELLHGCHRATTLAVRVRRTAFVEGLLTMLPVLPFGLPEARRHAELWAELARDGSMAGPHDMLVGATALARGDAVATLNQREFRRIAGLVVVDLGPYAT